MLAKNIAFTHCKLPASASGGRALLLRSLHAAPRLHGKLSRAAAVDRAAVSVESITDTAESSLALPVAAASSPTGAAAAAAAAPPADVETGDGEEMQQRQDQRQEQRTGQNAGDAFMVSATANSTKFGLQLAARLRQNPEASLYYTSLGAKASLNVLTTIIKAQQQLQSDNLALTFTLRRRRVPARQRQAGTAASPPEQGKAAAAAAEQPDEAATVADAQEDVVLVSQFMFRVAAIPAGDVKADSGFDHSRRSRAKKVKQETTEEQICSYGLRAIRKKQMPVSFSVSGPSLHVRASVLLQALNQLSYQAWSDTGTKLVFSVTRDIFEPTTRQPSAAASTAGDAAADDGQQQQQQPSSATAAAGQLQQQQQQADSTQLSTGNTATEEAGSDNAAASTSEALAAPPSGDAVSVPPYHNVRSLYTITAHLLLDMLNNRDDSQSGSGSPADALVATAKRSNRSQMIEVPLEEWKQLQEQLEVVPHLTEQLQIMTKQHEQLLSLLAAQQQQQQGQ